MPACPETVPAGNWSSNLVAETTMARQVTLGWSSDIRPGTTFYVVQFREVNVQTFNTSSPVSAYCNINGCTVLIYHSYIHVVLYCNLHVSMHGRCVFLISS